MPSPGPLPVGEGETKTSILGLTFTLLPTLLSQQINKIRRADKGRQQTRRDLIREQHHSSAPVRHHQHHPARQGDITICGIVRRNPIILAICGAINPTKLSGPMVMVAVAVRHAASSNSATRVGVNAMPTARAVSPPAAGSSSSGGTGHNRQQHDHYDPGMHHLTAGGVVR